MKICIENINSPINMKNNFITSLCVMNKTLYCKVAQAFALGRQDNSLCRFSVWDNDKQLSDSDLLIISDMFNLPFKDKAINKKISNMVEDNFSIDSNKRNLFITKVNELSELIKSTVSTMDTNFNFSVDVDIVKALNLLKFKPEYNLYDPLLENLINYFNLLNDLGQIRPTIIIGLKNFLADSDLKLLFDFVFSKKICLFLIDNIQSKCCLPYENKITIDQDFLETRNCKF